ncbi:MAG: sulfatase-like hydrolase/transferase [Verrucomicrobia bacterium]|nr:sulfatase-like hydrolase/transferase [Verrucomicrobiota bacterium]
MKYTYLILTALLLAPLAALHAADPPAKKPNIVFILADDLGFEALGAYGAKEYQGLGTVRTPNLEALAKGGMRFGKCFATPVC